MQGSGEEEGGESMSRDDHIEKIVNNLREYGVDFSDEMEKDVRTALDEMWFVGYRCAQEEARA